MEEMNKSGNKSYAAMKSGMNRRTAAKYLDLVPIGLHQIVGIQDVPARPFDAERERPGLMVQTPESLNSKRN